MTTIFVFGKEKNKFPFRLHACPTEKNIGLWYLLLITFERKQASRLRLAACLSLTRTHMTCSTGYWPQQMLQPILAHAVKIV